METKENAKENDKTSQNVTSGPGNNDSSEIEVYGKRWLILLVYVFCAAINAFQWIEYPIITNIVTRYYNVSASTVDWTSIIYMALFTPLILPATYIIDKMGIRTAGLVGAIGTAVGTSIKVFSIRRDLFYVVLIGQAIVAGSQVIIFILPPRLAAVWFKPNEVSTACALGVFGTQLGSAIGFVLPPIIIQNHENPEDIGPEIKIMCWTLTALVVVSLLAVLFCFPKQPPKPPSITQLNERKSKEVVSLSMYLVSVKKLLVNKNFVIHLVAYGLAIGVISVIWTLLNQFVLHYFPNCQEDAGRMGLVMIVVGMISSILTGIILDKTHKYKEIAIFTYFMSAIGLIAFIVALEMKSKILVYIAVAILGTFTNAYFFAGYELSMELTYPSTESTTTGVLLGPSQILGVAFTIFAGNLMVGTGPFWSMCSQVVLLILGMAITVFIPNVKLRQEAFKNENNKSEEANK